MTTAGLFTITNMWARLMWATHGQRDKAQHTPTMEYYSATERNDALRASCNMDELWKCDAWLRKPDANGHVVQLCLYEVSGIGNSRETEGNGWLPSAGAGGMTRHCLMGTECYVGLIEMLWNSKVEGRPTLCMHQVSLNYTLERYTTEVSINIYTLLYIE